MFSNISKVNPFVSNSRYWVCMYSVLRVNERGIHAKVFTFCLLNRRSVSCSVADFALVFGQKAAPTFWQTSIINVLLLIATHESAVFSSCELVLFSHSRCLLFCATFPRGKTISDAKSSFIVIDFNEWTELVKRFYLCQQRLDSIKQTIKNDNCESARRKWIGNEERGKRHKYYSVLF